MENTVNKNALHAILLSCAAYFLFCIGDVFFKDLGQAYPYAQIIGTINLAGLLVMGAWVLQKKGTNGFKTPHLKWHLFRGIFSTACSWLVLAALVKIGLVEFYTVIFLSPLTVTLMCLFFLGENPGRHTLLAIAAGFSGVLVLTLPQLGIINIGFLYVFLGMIAFSSGIVVLRVIGSNEFTPLYVFYTSLVGLVINGTIMLFSFKVPDIQGLFYFLILAVTGVIAQLTFALGKTRAPKAAIVMPFHYTQIVWGALLGYFVFGDVPTPATWAGATIIIGSGLYVILHQRKADKKLVARPA